MIYFLIWQMGYSLLLQSMPTPMESESKANIKQLTVPLLLDGSPSAQTKSSTGLKFVAQNHLPLDPTSVPATQEPAAKSESKSRKILRKASCSLVLISTRELLLSGIWVWQYSLASIQSRRSELLKWRQPMFTKEASVQSSGQAPFPYDGWRSRNAPMIKSILALTAQLRKYTDEHCFADNAQGLRITLPAWDSQGQKGKYASIRHSWDWMYFQCTTQQQSQLKIGRSIQWNEEHQMRRCREFIETLNLHRFQYSFWPALASVNLCHRIDRQRGRLCPVSRILKLWYWIYFIIYVDHKKSVFIVFIIQPNKQKMSSKSNRVMHL